MAIAIGGMRLISDHLCRGKSQTRQQDKPQALSMSVTVAPVETTRVARTLNTTGTVAAAVSHCRSQTTGLQIKQIPVEEGDVVKTGQVMAVLDNSVLQTELNQARAEVESNQAQVQQRQAWLKRPLAEAERILGRNQQL